MLKKEKKFQYICLVRKSLLKKSMPPSRHMRFPHFFQNGLLDWPSLSLETSVCLIAPSKNGPSRTVIGHSNLCHVAYVICVIGFKKVNQPSLKVVV